MHFFGPATRVAKRSHHLLDGMRPPLRDPSGTLCYHLASDLAEATINLVNRPFCGWLDRERGSAIGAAFVRWQPHCIHDDRAVRMELKRRRIKRGKTLLALDQ